MRQGAHGGDVYKAANYLGVTAADIADYSSNVSPWAVDIFGDIDVAGILSKLPEPGSESLNSKYAEKHNLPNENCMIISGTTEAIANICLLYSGRRASIAEPCYSDYRYWAEAHDMSVSSISAECSDIQSEDLGDICFICNPNNPSGAAVKREKLLELCRDNPETLFIIDESYIQFMMYEDDYTMLGCELENVVVLRSFSKIYGLPGLRLGAVYASKDIIGSLKKLISPWSVNSLAQFAGSKLLDVDVSYIPEKISVMREAFLDKIAQYSFLSPVKSDVNYMLLALKGYTSEEVFKHCLKRRVLIRDCSNFRGLSGEFIRVGLADNMQLLLECFDEIS